MRTQQYSDVALTLVASLTSARCQAVVLPFGLFLFAGEKVMADDEFTCDLFRFLQLLCEGHNNGESQY